MLNSVETDIILAVEGIEVDPAIPRTAVDPRYMRIHTRTNLGPLDLRVAIDAAPKLAEAIMTKTLAVTVHAENIDIQPDKAEGMVMLIAVSPDEAVSITLPLAGLRTLQTRISNLLDVST